MEFELVDPTTGRLKRCLKYHGTVDTPMELDDFPYDTHDLKVQFVTLSLWSTNDGSRKGALAKGKSYRCRQIREKGEGKLLLFKFDGNVLEWDLHRARYISPL